MCNCTRRSRDSGSALRATRNDDDLLPPAPSHFDAAPADIPLITHAMSKAASAASRLRSCLAPRDSRPATTSAPCLSRSENSPLPPAPSRHRAIPKAASAARATASSSLQAARGAARVSMSSARTSETPLPSSHALRNRFASSRRQKKHGRWPAANAVASSRKNSSVQLRPPMTSRRRPLNSQTQVSQARLAQRRLSKVLVWGS